ncbi:predicted protein [Plenodomus lingam JN3]|uniref:Predicted protein n=2 Tax=Leptosphaeria maculans TaxID=5022 RepID=E5A5E9_LEPMJ|nr:predicted protein [Plenodomus lingam JN3]CBX98847.1 predicted protein [Plenodomus lingam JN3]
MGLLPQVGGDVFADEAWVSGAGDAETRYVRNRFGLPGVDEMLSAEGVVGAEVLLQKQREEEGGAGVEVLGNRGQGRGERGNGSGRLDGLGKSAGVKKTTNWNKPFINGVSGTPRAEASLRAVVGAGGGAGLRTGAYASRANGASISSGNTGRVGMGIVGLGARVRKRYDDRPFPSQREV